MFEGWGVRASASSSEKGEVWHCGTHVTFPGAGRVEHTGQGLFSIFYCPDRLTCKLGFLPWHSLSGQRDVNKNSMELLEPYRLCHYAQGAGG